MKRWTVVVPIVLSALALSSCGSDKKPASPASGSTLPSGAISVVTTPDLKSVVDELVQTYKTQHPGSDVVVTADADNAVAKTVATGNPAIAIGNAAIFKDAKKDLPVASFGRNLAVIAVPVANPHHVTDVKAFAATSGLRTAVCGAKASFGVVTVAVLAKAGVTPAKGTVKSGCEAASLRAIAAGTLDAALVFRVGLTVPKGVTFVSIPDDQNLVFPFSSVTVGNSAGVSDFARFLASASARSILTKFGFLP